MHSIRDDLYIEYTQMLTGLRHTGVMYTLCVYGMYKYLKGNKTISELGMQTISKHNLDNLVVPIVIRKAELLYKLLDEVNKYCGTAAILSNIEVNRDLAKKIITKANRCIKDTNMKVSNIHLNNEYNIEIAKKSSNGTLKYMAKTISLNSLKEFLESIINICYDAKTTNNKDNYREIEHCLVETCTKIYLNCTIK
ncbi:MAG: hypothetical protein J6A59_12495 [Lachnospiraceae bacterium]|nr:hypothetical protein [Lachnospiraceae bacterium]